MMRAWAVAVKELRQIRRDRRSLVILLFVPTFFLFLYGYALNFDIRHVAMVVDDRDGSEESRALVAMFSESTYFDIVGNATDDRTSVNAVDRGVAASVLIIPASFGQLVRGGRTADVQVLIDGSNATSASTILGYVSGVLRQAETMWGTRPAVNLVTAEPRVWYNPELRSPVFLVPGLIAFISMITGVISTALSIVREVERNTIEQIRMAPISTASFVVGKTVPYLVLSQVGAMAIIVAAMIFFDLPMRGSWWALSAVVAVFLVGALGTGILISTIARTQDVAFQVAALVAMLPTLILSGFIFPIASMPLPLQIVSAVIPARHFLTALRGVVLKGLDLGSVAPSVLALGLYALVVLGLSALRLSRR
jgi:ABC-2 type transport system permease protein